MHSIVSKFCFLVLEPLDVNLQGSLTSFRNLIGWGIRNITFADYGKIAPSNPVRQSLYNFEDSVAGKFKAECAAEALLKIHPSIEAKGFRLKIQMPGHYIQEDEMEEAMKEVETLDKLIQEHDAIYLLLDTREARWLPSVIAAAYDKVELSHAVVFLSSSGL